MVDKEDNSNQLVVNEVEVDASLADVWEAVSSEEGRAEWLEDDRPVVVESAQAPGEDGYDSGRIVWWWWADGEPPRRVELLVVAMPATTRVIAIESAPALPLTMLAQSFSRVCA